MWTDIEECCCAVIKRINGCIIIHCGIRSEAKPKRAFKGKTATRMGNSRFRLSHVMPNVWFYKLRDIGRKANRGGQRSSEKPRFESSITLPRNSYHFGRAERVYASPGDQKPSESSFSELLEAMGTPQCEPRRRNTAGNNTKSKGKSKNKSRSYTLLDSKISAGCSCRATVGSVWKSRDGGEYWSSDESCEEFAESVQFRANQPILENCRTGKKNCEDIRKLDKLESEVAWDLPSLKLHQPRGQNFPVVGSQRSRQAANYASNNVAGLPSPVPEDCNGDEYEYEDFCLEFDDSVARNVKEIFEFVRDPYFVDTYITCSSSCCCRLSSSSVEINANGKDGGDDAAIGYGATEDVGIIEGNDVREVGILPFLAKSADLDMEMKQGYVEDWEESKPSLIRRRNVVSSQEEVKSSEPTVSESRRRVHPSEITSLNEQTLSISGKRVDSGAATVKSPAKGKGNSQPSEIPARKTVIERRLSPVKAKPNVRSVSDSSRSEIGNGRTEVFQRSTGHRIRKSKVSSPRPCARIQKPNGSGPSKPNKIVNEQSGGHVKDARHKISAEDSQGVAASSSSSSIGIAATAAESYAVVKCSYDPQRDFRDSMVEMIVEHGLRYPEDLQQLLRCYLSLNSDEYHDIIVRVFEQVRSDLANIRV